MTPHPPTHTLEYLMAAGSPSIQLGLVGSHVM